MHVRMGGGPSLCQMGRQHYLQITVQSTGALKMRDRKMEDRKMEEQIWGQARRWKMRDWKMQDHGS